MIPLVLLLAMANFGGRIGHCQTSLHCLVLGKMKEREREQTLFKLCTTTRFGDGVQTAIHQNGHLPASWQWRNGRMKAEKLKLN